MKKYATPSIASFSKNDAVELIRMEACPCGGTGYSSIPKCGGGGARA